MYMCSSKRVHNSETYIDGLVQDRAWITAVSQNAIDFFIKITQIYMSI